MERTELVEAVDFLINTGTLNQLVEVAVSEVKRQPSDDWCSRTCGECGWAFKPTTAGPLLCRRTAWADDGTNAFGDVLVDSPACPAFAKRNINEKL